MLVRAQLVAVDRRAGLGADQGAPVEVEVEGLGQGVELGVGGDPGAGLPGLDLALDNAARVGRRLLAEPQLDPPVEDHAARPVRLRSRSDGVPWMAGSPYSSQRCHHGCCCWRAAAASRSTIQVRASAAVVNPARMGLPSIRRRRSSGGYTRLRMK